VVPPSVVQAPSARALADMVTSAVAASLDFIVTPLGVVNIGVEVVVMRAAGSRVAVPLPRCAPAAHGCDGASALCWPCGLLVGVLLLRWVLWCAGRSRHWGSSARPPS
jgi:hypothetical protein